MNRYTVLAAAGFATVSLTATDVAADEPIVTGSYIPLDRSYQVSHQIEKVPADKSVVGVVEADLDKRIVLSIKTEVSCQQLAQDLSSALGRVGFSDNRAIGVCQAPTVKARTQISFDYEHASGTTRLHVAGQGTVAYQGRAAMLAFWRMWFLERDGGKAGLQLVARL